MSKIGKKNITIPKESSIKIEGPNLTISGPKGSKTLTINDKIFSASQKESGFQIQPLQKKLDKKTSQTLSESDKKHIDWIDNFIDMWYYAEEN